MKVKINQIKLAILMVKRDWNTEETAKNAGVARQTVSYIKNGKSCTDRTAIKIANALGVEVTDLLED